MTTTTLTASPTVAVAPVPEVILSAHSELIRPLTCALCGVTTLHTRRAPGFVCDCCGEVMTVYEIEKFDWSA